MIARTLQDVNARARVGFVVAHDCKEAFLQHLRFCQERKLSLAVLHDSGHHWLQELPKQISVQTLDFGAVERRRMARFCSILFYLGPFCRVVNRGEVVRSWSG